MPLRLSPVLSRSLRIAAVFVPFIVFFVWFWHPLSQVAALCGIAAVMAFILAPLANLLEKRLSRPPAALLSVGLMLALLATFVGMLLPTLIRQAAQLAQALPKSLDVVSGWFGTASKWLEHRLPGISFPALPLEGLSGALTGVASGTITLAGNAAGALSRVSLALMLCFFFLCDRQNLLLRMEWLVPLAWRRTVIRMGAAVGREVRLYLRGQLLIALAVGSLSAAGLFLVGVRNAPVLGIVVGLLNMIPYFGPIIGGIPAVLMALGDGPGKAALCAGVLTIVQQIDSAIISPRILGGITGFSPAVVLLAIFAGAQLGGIVGMLCALPLLMSIRTVFRVFVQRCENI